MLYDPHIFNIYESINHDDYILALYYTEVETADILLRASALAVEQSTGTWVPIPEETDDVKARSIAKVIGVHEIPDFEDRIPGDVTVRKFICHVAFPTVNINFQIPELLTVLYGNISMVGKLKLMDVHFPQSFINGFKGPKFGIEGVRNILNVYDRPVLCGMFKPCIGASPETLGNMYYDMAIGGIDVIKDDELLADPVFCSVEARLEQCLKAAERAEKDTGRKSIYCVNVTDSPARMYKKALNAIKKGATGLMVNTYTVGFATLQELAEDPAITVPIMTHPAMAGTFFESPERGFTSNLILGKFARLSGSDIIIYPGPYGKVPLVRERALRVADELRAPFYGMNRTFPGPAAGMHPGLVEQMIKDFGMDLVIGAGGGVHGHPDGCIAGGKAFHQAFDTVKAGLSLREGAETRKDLARALDKWGVYGEGKQIYSLTT